MWPLPLHKYIIVILLATNHSRKMFVNCKVPRHSSHDAMSLLFGTVRRMRDISQHQFNSEYGMYSSLTILYGHLPAHV